VKTCGSPLSCRIRPDHGGVCVKVVKKTRRSQYFPIPPHHNHGYEIPFRRVKRVPPSESIIKKREITNCVFMCCYVFACTYLFVLSGRICICRYLCVCVYYIRNSLYIIYPVGHAPRVPSSSIVIVCTGGVVEDRGRLESTHCGAVWW